MGGLLFVFAFFHGVDGFGTTSGSIFGTIFDREEKLHADGTRFGPTVCDFNGTTKIDGCTEQIWNKGAPTLEKSAGDIAALSALGLERTPVLLQAALQLDLSLIKYRLVKHSWDSMFGTDVDRALVEYRKFLVLITINENRIPLAPSKQVDEVWHAHILHTRKYDMDTRAVAGYYINHLPTPPPSESIIELCNSAAYDWTLDLYRMAFGVEPDPAVWTQRCKGNGNDELESCDSCGAQNCRAQDECNR